MKNPFSGLFRARDKPRAHVAAGRRLRRAYVLLRHQRCRASPSPPSSAIQLSTVYACVRVIAETSRQPAAAMCMRPPTRAAVKALEHPLYRLLHDEPNPEMTSFIWREIDAVPPASLWGNTLLPDHPQRDATASSACIRCCPDHMEVDRDSKGNLTYTYTTSEGQTWCARPAGRPAHPRPRLSTASWATAPSRWRRAPSVWASPSEEYGSKFFSATAPEPSGILTHPNTVKDPEAPCGKAGTQPMAAPPIPAAWRSWRRA